MSKFEQYQPERRFPGLVSSLRKNPEKRIVNFTNLASENSLKNINFDLPDSPEMDEIKALLGLENSNKNSNK